MPSSDWDFVDNCSIRAGFLLDLRWEGDINVRNLVVNGNHKIDARNFRDKLQSFWMLPSCFGERRMSIMIRLTTLNCL